MYCQLINEIQQLQPAEKKLLRFAYQKMLMNESFSTQETKAISQLPYTVCEDNTIIAVFGLDTRPSLHSISIANHSLYTWCIWDAFFIAEVIASNTALVEMMTQDIIITSKDPVSDEPITATLTHGRTDKQWHVTDTYCCTFPTEDASNEKSLRSSFCRFVSLFANKKNAQSQQQQFCEIFPITTLIERGKEMANAING